MFNVQKVIALIAFAAQVAVNAYYGPKMQDKFRPELIAAQPSPKAFAIWGLLYILQPLAIIRTPHDAHRQLWRMSASCVLNSLWLALVFNNVNLLQFVDMLVLLSTVVRMYLFREEHQEPGVHVTQLFAGLYTGWMVQATGLAAFFAWPTLSTPYIISALAVCMTLQLLVAIPQRIPWNLLSALWANYHTCRRESRAVRIMASIALTVETGAFLAKLRRATK